MQSIQSPLPQFFDLDGSPLDAGYVYVGEANLNPETNPLPVFWDLGGTQPAAQPLRTVAGYIARIGKASPAFASGISYSLKVLDKNRRLVYSTNKNETNDAARWLTDVLGTNTITGTADDLTAYQIGQQFIFRAVAANTGPVTLNINGLGAIAVTKLGAATLTAGDIAANQVVSVVYDGATFQAQIGTARLYVNVRDFGAVGDGVTDDAAAITSADASAAAAGAGLFFPGGTYAVGSTVTMTARSWSGVSEFSSIIRRRAAATMASAVQVGPSAGTSTLSNVAIDRLGFDGNGGCFDAVLKIRNVQRSRISFIRVLGGLANGLETETSTASINTNQLRNEYTSIVATGNAGIGMTFHGEKDSRFDQLLAHDNTGAGIEFRAFKDDSNSLCETTQCTIGSIMSRDNGGDGVIFDAAEKFSCGAILTSINGGAGVRFRSTQTGAASNGSNSVVIGSLVCRNDALGGVRAADSAYVSGLEIGSAYLLGFNSLVGVPGVLLNGVNRVYFGTCVILGYQGTGMTIQQGTPLGVATQSSQITIGALLITGNGNVGSATNHGLAIFNSTQDVSIGHLRSSNNQTTGANFEMNVAASVLNLHVGYAHLQAATAGNEENIGNSESYITTYKRRLDAATITLRDGVTAPGTNLTGHAQLYIDAADGDLKIRFADGLVVTIVTD
jgi:hypothetical protein